MTSMSKIFYEVTKGKTCADFCHPNQGCVNYVFSLLHVLPKGCFKLYVPLLVIPPLLKGKQANRKYLERHVKEYVDLSLKTFIQAFVALSSVCVLHALFGKVQFFGIMAIPGMMSALLAPKMIHTHLRLQSLTFFNMMIEVLIKKSSFNIVKILRHSKLFGTASFMLMSSVIMNVLQKDTTTQFWLATPLKPMDENENVEGTKPKCLHESDCWRFILKEVLKYASVGLLLELAHNSIRFFPVLLKNLPKSFFSHVFKSMKLSLPLFLASYVGLFRGITCLIHRFSKNTIPTYTSALAGFMSGIAYWLYPKYNIWTMALTKSIELFWSFRSKFWDEQSSFGKMKSAINKFPLLFWMRVISLGVMYHTALFYPHLSPMFNSKAFNFCSDNAVEKMKLFFFGSVLNAANSQTW